MAVKTKATLTSDATSEFPTNGTGVITATALRTFLIDMIDSLQAQAVTYTTGERDAIASPTSKTVIYNSDNKRFEYYDGTSWLPFGFVPVPVDLSTNPDYPAATSGDCFYITGAGRIGGAAGLYLKFGDFIICNQSNAGGDYATASQYFTHIKASSDYGDGSSFVGSGASTTSTNNVSIGQSASTDADKANAIGQKAVARIQRTTVISGPIIARKSDGTATIDPWAYYAGAEVVIWTDEIDLKTTSSHSITIPAGIKLFVEDCGIVCTAANTVTVTPHGKFGDGTTMDLIHAAANLSDMDTVGHRSLLGSSYQHSVGGLSFDVSTAATATTCKGRAYFKCIVIESQ